MANFLKILLILISVQAFSQGRGFVLVDRQSKAEYSRKDSISAVKFLDSLVENNYYFTKIVKTEDLGGKIRITFDKGRDFNRALVRYDTLLAKEMGEAQPFFTNNLDSLRASIHKAYAEKGFAFSRVKTQYLGIKNDLPQVEISVLKNQQRRITGIVLRSHTQVPRRFVRNIEKDFVGKVYSEGALSELYRSLQNHRFLSLEKPPQTLFTKDSTQIFLFFQKKKTNTFDGIIGFGNDKTEKFTFNGSLNLAFRNMFNGFEDISLYWQRNPDRGQTFDLKTRIPYLFTTNIGLDAQLNIYKQDSTFATVKAQPSLFYNLSERQKIGLRASFEVSTVLDSLYTSAKDFSRSGIGLWYEYQQPTEVELFLYGSKIRAEGDYLKTLYPKDGSAALLRYTLYAEKNFHLSGRHYLNLKGESAMLSTPLPLSVNELLRTGGWNSFRGFNENALISDFYAYTGAEYRYLASDTAFFDVFAQYGLLRNKTLGIRPKFYSVGLGFNFSLPMGLITFQVSNGAQSGEPFRFKETKIHWGILSKF